MLTECDAFSNNIAKQNLQRRGTAARSAVSNFNRGAVAPRRATTPMEKILFRISFKKKCSRWKGWETILRQHCILLNLIFSQFFCFKFQTHQKVKIFLWNYVLSWICRGEWNLRWFKMSSSKNARFWPSNSPPESPLKFQRFSTKFKNFKFRS